MDAGTDGVAVSHHGGRQVNGAVGSAEVLPAVAGAVGDHVDVLSGRRIRTGDDVLQALALGARAVLLGRPYVYGPALDGQSGVEHVVPSLLAEFEPALAPSCFTRPREAGPDCLVRAPGARRCRPCVGSLEALSTRRAYTLSSTLRTSSATRCLTLCQRLQYCRGNQRRSWRSGR
ncbi:hypothetical protein GCM10010446_28660 [Streptomyces enissocaesilis]|uniref:FMN hydroxy acid dehydrogenase domain-containing protein n=1 Tax=Streptomyces enissocaesilis TaxID=332589 RepID=A0ABN3XA34_9ACTN